MSLNDDDIIDFAKAQLSSFDLSEFEVDQEVALEELCEEIVSNWEELNSDEVKISRHEHFQIPNTTSEDYSEKVFEIGRDKKVIYGIRHMGGSKDHPFVFIKPNFDINNSKEALSIYKNFKDEFISFAPIFLSFWTNKQIETDMRGSTYLVTQAFKMRKIDTWKDENELKLVQVKDESYYDWYKEGYDRFHQERPDLKNKVSVNTLEDMSGCLEDGLIYKAYYQNEKIGLIAAEMSPFLGHRGIYFHEIFVNQDWKGKGLAKAIQRKFVDQVAYDNDFIWGTVDHYNIPSYKTALANTRLPIRFENFIKV